MYHSRVSNIHLLLLHFSFLLQTQLTLAGILNLLCLICIICLLRAFEHIHMELMCDINVYYYLLLFCSKSIIWVIFLTEDTCILNFMYLNLRFLFENFFYCRKSQLLSPA